VVVLIFGLHLLGLLKIPFLYKEKKVHLKLNKKPKYRLLQAFLIGLAFAFGWTPCVGPILGMILTMAMQQEHVSHGMILLTSYSLGLWLPFFIAAVFTVPVLGFLAKRPQIALRAGQISGVLLIIMGILLISGQMLRLSALLA
jgi:cytochrome c-type biogenesis protein